MDELRALLLLWSNPQTEWNAVEVCTKLYIQPATASAVLASLASRGLLAANADRTRYHYHPQNQELAKLVEELAAMDRERPVTLINMIYDRPKDFQAFADAFRLKKDKPN